MTIINNTTSTTTENTVISTMSPSSLNDSLYALDPKFEFHFVACLDRMSVFEVSYYILGKNRTPHFTTSAAQFIRSKRDWATCGQAQEHVLGHGSKAYRFYKKWDKVHLCTLTLEDYEAMRKDLEDLKARCSCYLFKTKTPEMIAAGSELRTFSFEAIKLLSMTYGQKKGLNCVK